MKIEEKSIWIALLCFVVFVLSCRVTGPCDESQITDEQVVYKQTPQGELKLHIFECGRRSNRPAVVFFFGGGWVGGSVQQFLPHCRYFAAKGMVAIAAEYRIRNKHGTTPFECVADGKSAIRYVRAHAKELGINPSKIVASGGSAGGHVAACTAIIEGFDETAEDKTISSKPNVLVLFNPVIDTTERGYGAEKLKGQTETLSPVHHVVSGLPPTIIFHGTADTTVPFENVERFCMKMHDAGNRCELVPFEGMKHGFFNYTREEDHASYNATTQRAEQFLRSLGYIR